jgi:SAM-dependent methyltransferase
LRYIMTNLDQQLDYWNDAGTAKPFNHPVNLDRLSSYLTSDSRILDYGCGYGRVLGVLLGHGYLNLWGLDPAPAMIDAARARYPLIDFQELENPPLLEFPDQSFHATLLFSVLTCVPSDEGQIAIVSEIQRILRPGGVLYVSDLWLQTDARNRERYIRDESKYGTYGVFDLPEGVTVRHHDPCWIEQLTRDFQTVALDNIDVLTMNGNPAKAFQWFGLKQVSEA